MQWDVWRLGARLIWPEACCDLVNQLFRAQAPRNARRIKFATRRMAGFRLSQLTPFLKLL